MGHLTITFLTICHLFTSKSSLSAPGPQVRSLRAAASSRPALLLLLSLSPADSSSRSRPQVPVLPSGCLQPRHEAFSGVPRRGHPLGGMVVPSWASHSSVSTCGRSPSGFSPWAAPRKVFPHGNPLPAGGTPTLGPSPPSQTFHPRSRPTGVLLSCWGLKFDHPLFLCEGGFFLRGPGEEPQSKG